MPLLFLALFGLGCGLMDVIASTEEEPSQTVVESSAQPESPPAPEPPPQPPPPTPQEARNWLKENDVSYSQKSFFENVKDGNLKVVALFLIAGMDVDIRNEGETQDTALMWACEYKHFEIVKLLLENDADIYAFNALNQNALMFASFGGSLRIVKYLIENRASMRIPAVIGGSGVLPRTALGWAAYAGHLDIVRYFTEEVGTYGRPYDCTSINKQGLSCDAAMSWAAFKGHLQIVRFFAIDKETPLNPYNGRGPTALMYAASAGHGPIVSFLLENGANIHVRSSSFTPIETPHGTDYIEEFGHSALTLAIDFGNSHITQILVEHWMFTEGSDSKDRFNRTPLMFAAAGGLPETVLSLIENGAEINATTKVGGTALIYAAAMGRLDCVKLLLQHGADKDIRNDNGYTAYSVAQERGHTSVAEYINNA